MNKVMDALILQYVKCIYYAICITRNNTVAK